MKTAVLARALACVATAALATPAEARFLQVDPVGYDDQINLYAYVANDPVNFIDSTGREAILVRELNGGQTLLIPYRLQSSTVTGGDLSRVVSGYKIDGAGLQIQVLNTNTPILGMLNEVTVGSGPNNSACGAIGECTFVTAPGQDNVYIDGTQAMAAEATAHDLVGHAGGSLQDGYLLKDGKRTDELKPGYTRDQVMSTRDGTRFTAQEAENMKANADRLGCRKQDGSVAEC